jgi:hypothetical protein
METLETDLEAKILTDLAQSPNLTDEQRRIIERAAAVMAERCQILRRLGVYS